MAAWVETPETFELKDLVKSCEIEKVEKTYTQFKKNFRRIEWYDLGFFDSIRFSSLR